MSEFHDAFYTTCVLHKEEHYPKWRKCPKCKIVKVYSEKEIIALIHKFAIDYGKPIYTSQFDRWIGENIKK